MKCNAQNGNLQLGRPTLADADNYKGDVNTDSSQFLEIRRIEPGARNVDGTEPFAM